MAERTRRCEIRFTESEYRNLMAKAEKAGISVSALIRKSVDDCEVKAAPPADLHKLTAVERRLLCEEIRQFLLNHIAETGGHLASNLGIVEISTALVRVMAEQPKVAKHFHLPFQSGNDRILSAMNRKYNREQYLEKALSIKEKVKDVSLTSDVIVGFPGETEEDFQCLAEFVKQERFSRAGVFTYSREEGTPAYDFPDQIDEQVKQDRYDILMQTQLTITEEQNEEKIGKTIEVLCEGFDRIAECWYGRTYADAPEVDGCVFFTTDGNKPKTGEFVNVNITDYLGIDPVGEII